MQTKKKKLVILSGAGISEESGIQTFRGSNGLWEGYQITDVATPGAWKKDPAMVLRFYNERRQRIKNAHPNAAHKILASLEHFFEVKIITQNIDDLHERAGSTNVLHIHGEIFKMRSEHNESLVVPIDDDIHLGDYAADGNQYRPHIVWFQEPVPLIENAIQIAQMADILVVIGTSLVVYPAASILDYLRPSIPVYVVDKKVPIIQRSLVTYIEETATVGVASLKKILLEKYL